MAVHGYYKSLYMGTVTGLPLELPGQEDLVASLNDDYESVFDAMLHQSQRDRYAALQQRYACAQWFVNECNDDVEQFTNAITNVFSTRIKEWHDAIKLFSEATDRLGNVFNDVAGLPTSADYRERREQLIAAMWWRAKGNIWGFLDVRWYADITPIREDLSRRTSAWKRASQVKQTTQPQTRKHELRVVYRGSTTPGQRADDAYLYTALRNTMDESFSSLERSHQRTRGAQWGAITRQAVQLSVSMTSVAEHIGAGDTKWSVARLLWQACELQCTNVPNKKCQA